MQKQYIIIDNTEWKVIIDERKIKLKTEGEINSNTVNRLLKAIRKTLPKEGYEKINSWNYWKIKEVQYGKRVKEKSHYKIFVDGLINNKFMQVNNDEIVYITDILRKPSYKNSFISIFLEIID